MQYREIKPNASAARFVKCYWLLEDGLLEDGAPTSSHQRVVPDGRAQLILNLGRPYEVQTEQKWQLQPQCFFIGQITAPLVLRASGPFRMIGINFHPHTAGQLLKISMCELTDTAAVSLDDFSGQLCQEFNRIRELRSPLEWFPVLDHIVHTLGERADTDNRLLSAAVKELERVGGLMRIAAVADHAGVSLRQFERRFIQAVGITPKLFSRIQRFQRVFPVLEREHSGWADAAVRCGYYDQAHLIRDFRELAGKTPLALLAEETDLARHFLQSASLSHFSETGRAVEANLHSSLSVDHE
jgi:AraC-like DNA-binding protein